ncbi:MAG: helix-turn-helix domain-containing protein [Limnohabitans sp.]
MLTIFFSPYSFLILAKTIKKDDINNKIKSGLRDRNITQLSIAKMLRVHPVCVHEVVTGKRKNPRIRLAISLAIGKPVSELWPYQQQNKDACSQNIKAELVRKGISQRELAVMLKTSPVSVNNVVSGLLKTPRIRRAISMAIGKPVSEIWPETPSNKGEI